jgi:hypothetical protein
MGAEQEKLVVEQRIGQTLIRIYRPDLFEEKREQCLRTIYQVLCRCYQSAVQDCPEQKKE